MNRKSPLILCLLFSVVLVLEIGCARKPDDAKISSDIQTKFSQDSGLVREATLGAVREWRGYTQRQCRQRRSARSRKPSGRVGSRSKRGRQ